MLRVMMTATILFGVSISMGETEATTTAPSGDTPAAAANRAIAAEATANLDDVIALALTKVISKIEGTKGRVAVMDFPALDGRATGLSTYVANKAGNKLIEVGRQVVDRVTLERVISEQKLQQNSLMDAATAAKVGKLAGAGVFIIGNYTVLSNKFVLTVRALSVESGQFIPGAVAEQTVRPVPTEMAAELAELAGGSPQRVGTVDLTGGGGTDSKQLTEEEREALKAEIAFDKKVCAMMQPGLGFGKVVKVAYDVGFKDIDELQKIDMNTNPVDATGERKGCGTTFGDWTFSTDNCGWRAEHTGEALKGKNNGHALIDAWFYSGPDSLPGLASCAPNKKGWWNERRSMGGKKRK